MKSNQHSFKVFLFVAILLTGRLVSAQQYTYYISNDHLVSPTVYEFDVNIQNNSGVDFLFRTAQHCFTFNFPFVGGTNISAEVVSTNPIGFQVTSSQLNSFVIPSPPTWSSGAPGFQVPANIVTTCSTGTIIPASGTSLRVATFRLTATGGQFGCAPSNPNIVINGDPNPSGLTLKTVITMWNDNTCVSSSFNMVSMPPSQYTRYPSQSQYTFVNNIRPSITSQPPSLYTTCSGSGGYASFSIGVTGNGLSFPIQYQWYENGIPLSDGVGANATYLGSNSSTLQISNPLATLDGSNYTCTVFQCSFSMSRTSTAVSLHVNNTDDGNACTTDACNSGTGAVTHTTINTDDSNVCTTDGCNTVSGVFHTPLNTDDGISTTVDGCNPVTGLFHTSQATTAIPYQAVARDNSGIVIANQVISLRFSLHDTVPGGTIVYKEIQTATTNSLGSFNVNFGQGIPFSGTFSSINWANEVKFLQVEMDPTGGISYIDMGTQQLLSVPYALLAASTANIVKVTSVTTSMTIGPNTPGTQTYNIPGATIGSSVLVSPGTALITGLVIAYSRVSADNTVEVSYRNTTGSGIVLPAGIPLYIAVIK